MITRDAYLARDSRVAKRRHFWFDGHMKNTVVAFALALTFVCCCAPASGMSKKPAFTITVHGQAAVEDNPRMIFPETIEGQQVVFKLIPDISQHNIAAIHTFPAQDGNGNGLAMKLDMRGTNTLESATRTRPGELLLAKVNGKTVDYVTMDRPVTDGIFTIWSGVSDEVVAELAKKYPRIGQARSAARGIDMLPSTKKEKRDANARAKEEDKMKAKTDAATARGEVPGEKKKKGGFLGIFGKRKPKDDAGIEEPVPQGAATTQIPLEGGGTPAPLPPGPEPALPLRVNEPLPQR